MANPFTSKQAPASSTMQIIAPDLIPNQLRNERLQQLAAILKQQGLTEDNETTQVINGWAMPRSKLQGINKVAQALLGGLLQNKADKDTSDLQKAYANRLTQSAFGGGGAIPGGDASQGDIATGSADGSNPMRMMAQTLSGGGQSNDPYSRENVMRAAALGQFSPAAEKQFWEDNARTEMAKQNEYLGITPAQAQQMEMAKRIKDGTQSFQPGQLNVLPNGQKVVAPDFNAGIAGGFDANGMPVANAIQGSQQIAADRAAAIASANEMAKVQTYTTPEGESMVMTNAQALGGAPAQNSMLQPMGNAPLYTDIDQKYGFPAGTMASIAKVESNNNPNAVSPKGAQGIFQMMPGTQRDPGYGLGPLNPNNPEDAAKYLAKMRDLSGGDLTQAIGKYNAGPGGNLNNPETSNYIKKVTAGVPSYRSPGMKVQSAAQAEYAKDDAKQKVDFASKYEESMSDRLKKSSELMQRLNLTEQALKEFKAGGGTEVRAKLAQQAQLFGLPQEIIDRVAGGDLGAMQVVNKTALTESLLQMQHDLASDTGAQQRSNQMIMEKFMDANPHLDTDPRAWEKLMNLQKEMYAGKLSEAKEYWEYKDKNKGDTRKFPTYWAEQKSTKLDSAKTNNNPYASQKGKTPVNIQQLLDKYK